MIMATRNKFDFPIKHLLISVDLNFENTRATTLVVFPNGYRRRNPENGQCLIKLQCSCSSFQSYRITFVQNSPKHTSLGANRTCE